MFRFLLRRFRVTLVDNNRATTKSTADACFSAVAEFLVINKMQIMS